VFNAIGECALTPEHGFAPPIIPGTLTGNDLATEAFRSMFREALELFLSNDRVSREIDLLRTSEAQIGRDRLLFHIYRVHFSAIQAAYEAYLKRGLLNGQPFQIPPAKEIPGERMLDSGNPSTMARLWELSSDVFDQQALRLMYNQRITDPGQSSRKRDWLVVRFPSLYVEALVESLIHPPWYAACFSAQCENASMWSAYADGHRGLALMFRVDKHGSDDLRLPLEGVTGVSSVFAGTQRHRPIVGRANHRLHRVTYAPGAPKIDFFRYIGQLPRPALLKTWLQDETGNVSPRLTNVRHDDEWRAELWKLFQESAIRKLPEWEHEQEYRIVVPDLLGLRANHPDFRYDFSSLDGIVFGMRTSDEDKLAVMEIVEAKCRRDNRADFQFFNARYSPLEGRLVVRPMPLLKLARDQEDTPP